MQRANTAYEEAYAIDLPSCNPIKLSLALNFSVFNYEILKNHAKACEIAAHAVEHALEAMD